MNDCINDLANQKYYMVDFFSGAGGLSYGLKQAGFHPLFSFDLDPYACQTYRHNLGDHIIQADASDITAELVCEKTGLTPGEFTLVCGGPPCQGFSIQRRGQLEDPRNELVIKFAKLAIALCPTFILIENVPTILGKRGKKQLEEVFELITLNGYDYEAKVVNAADFGAPQSRRRAIIIAWKRDKVQNFTFPGRTHNESNWVTVRSAISDLPEPPLDYSEHPDYQNHTRVRISELNELRIAHVPPGGGRLDLPEHLQLPCHKNDNGHRHLDVFGRMEWDKAAPTITAMFDSFTRGRFAHPEKNRPITAREGARIQTFPDCFEFIGPKKDVARQIGNAVPPLLAQRIGESILASLRGQLLASNEPYQLLLPLR